jgi:hypothetical protein
MLTALAILLIRQYRIAGSPQEFFKWLSQSIHLYAFKAVHVGLAFILVAAFLK